MAAAEWRNRAIHRPPDRPLHHHCRRCRQMEVTGGATRWRRRLHAIPRLLRICGTSPADESSLPAAQLKAECTCVPFVAYGRSKTANIVLAVAFDQRHRKRGYVLRRRIRSHTDGTDPTCESKLATDKGRRDQSAPGSRRQCAHSLRKALNIATRLRYLTGKVSS